MKLNIKLIDPGGISEIAEMLGVTNLQVSQYKIHGKLPAPSKELAIGSVWDRQAIAEHISNGGINDRRIKDI